MSRRNRRGFERPTGEAGGAAEEEETTGEEEEPTDEQQETSIADLTTTADPEFFDRTFMLSSDGVPIATGETPAIPRPWEGLPRMAVVYNFNYVYDETAEEWVRQNPFSGTLQAGGFGEIVAQEDLTIPSGGVIELDTGVAEEAAAIFGWCGFRNASALPEPPEVWLSDNTSTSADAHVQVASQYNFNINEWQITYRDGGFNTAIDIRASAFRIA